MMLMDNYPKYDIKPHMINEQLKEAFYHKQRVSKKDSKI